MPVATEEKFRNAVHFLSRKLDELLEIPGWRRRICVSFQRVLAGSKLVEQAKFPLGKEHLISCAKHIVGSENVKRFLEEHGGMHIVFEVYASPSAQLFLKLTVCSSDNQRHRQLVFVPQGQQEHSQ